LPTVKAKWANILQVLIGRNKNMEELRRSEKERRYEDRKEKKIDRKRERRRG
jgi:hypothetical protein